MQLTLKIFKQSLNNINYLRLKFKTLNNSRERIFDAFASFVLSKRNDEFRQASQPTSGKRAR